PETHAAIVRINADGTGLEYVARGVRNSVGHDFHPVTKELYFSNHGRDWLGEDVPNDTLHHVVQRGVHFGYPMCHQGDILDPAFVQEMKDGSLLIADDYAGAIYRVSYQK